MHSLRLQDFFSRQIDAFGICNTKGSPVLTGLPNGLHGGNIFRTIILFHLINIKPSPSTALPADPLKTFQLLFLSHIPVNEKQIENDQKKSKAGKGHDHIRT